MVASAAGARSGARDGAVGSGEGGGTCKSFCAGGAGQAVEKFSAWSYAADQSELSGEAAHRAGISITELDRVRSAGLLHPVASVARGPRFAPADVEKAFAPQELTGRDRRHLYAACGAGTLVLALIVWAVAR